MKINLIIFAKNTKLSNQLQNYIDNDKADNTRTLLDKYFPSDSIAFAHDRLVLEMGDLIASLHDADDIISYLEELQDTTEQLIGIYYKNKEIAINNFNVINYHSKPKYIGMNAKNREKIGYTPENIATMLSQLDAQDAYQCYVDGYEYERYQLYAWLKHHIKESLSGKKHDTRVYITDPLKHIELQTKSINEE